VASPSHVGAGFPTCTMASGTKRVPQVEKPVFAKAVSLHTID
jgi:hypothetical protein